MNNNWCLCQRSLSHPWLGRVGYDYRSVVSKCLPQSLNLYFLPWKILLRWYGNQPFLILQSMCIHQRVYICVRNVTSFKDEVSGGNAGLSSVYKISKMVRALWLVKNLWFIVPVNSWKLSFTLSYFIKAFCFGLWFTSSFRVLPTPRVGYHAGKPIENVVYCLSTKDK